MPGAIPVTVVGGYLGAGKTTLINHLLNGGHGRRLAVLVNDFGEINIDARLIARHDGATIALSNGCVCCSIAGDLGAALKQVAAGRPAPDHIVVEASGVADPARTANYARGWPEFRPQGIVVLADAETVRERAGDKFVGGTVRRQIAAAELIVLNKTDLADAGQLSATAEWLAALSPAASIVPALHGQLDWAQLLGPQRDAADPAPQDDSDGDHLALHATLSWTGDVPLDRRRFADLLTELGPTLLRCKGWLRLLDMPTQSTAVQAAGQRLDLSSGPTAGGGPANCLVFVLRRDGIAPEDLRRRLDGLAD